MYFDFLRYKIGAGVELFLNLAWLAVALAMVCLWFCDRNRSHFEKQSDMRRQLVAIAVLVAILFPVISVSDDLLAIQNASEADNYLRRDHLVPSDAHPVQPVSCVVPPMLFAGLGMVFLRFVAPGILPVQKLAHPELAAIDNRPPPAV
jgi:hypothetical protein